MSTVLSQEDIYRLIHQDPPLVESYTDLKEQLQPNGIDLTLREIAIPQSSGSITVSNQQRQLSDLAPLKFDGRDSISLMPGGYVVTYNEIVHLPKNIMGLIFPRSSLLRCGVTVHTAVWDAGYHGRGQSLLTVYNPSGIRLQKNARIVQLVFYRLTQETEGYQGTYQKENI